MLYSTIHIKLVACRHTGTHTHSTRANCVRRRSMNIGTYKQKLLFPPISVMCICIKHLECGIERVYCLYEYTGRLGKRHTDFLHTQKTFPEIYALYQACTVSTQCNITLVVISRLHKMCRSFSWSVTVRQIRRVYVRS